MELSASDTIVNNKKYETWPVIYKSGEKQMANLLWYNEGLYVDLPVGYVEDLTQVYDSSVGTIQYKQKIKFPPKLYYPMVKDENDERTEYNDSSQYNNNNTYLYYPERMMNVEETQLKPKKMIIKKKKESSAFQTLQSLAFSLLDQWLFSAQDAEKVAIQSKSNQKPRSSDIDKNKNVENKLTKVSQTHPMRYLFLLGVLPTTFGSLYSLGYSPIQIMVIGAYIVTSYFIFVEKHPETKKEDIYGAIEETIAKVIENEDLDLINVVAMDNNNNNNNLLQNLKKDDKNYRFTNSKNNVVKDFELSDLLDSKSAAFIQKFDFAMSKLFD